MLLAEALSEHIENFCPTWNEDQKKAFLRLIFYEFYYELNHFTLNNSDEKITHRKVKELIHDLKNYL
jgi:hypothetical protein